jgi:hypothetical protein
MPIDIKKYRELRRKYLRYMARYKKLSDKQSTLLMYIGNDKDKAKANLKAYISMLMLGMLQVLGMPEIKKERLEGAIGNILKPDKLGLQIGDKVQVTIVAPHAESKDGYLSVPVRLQDGREGNFPLNLTHTRMMIDKMGWNSDNWVGATFTAVVVPQNNPQTKASVKSWSVLRDTIVPPKSKSRKLEA